MCCFVDVQGVHLVTVDMLRELFALAAPRALSLSSCRRVRRALRAKRLSKRVGALLLSFFVVLALFKSSI